VRKTAVPGTRVGGLPCCRLPESFRRSSGIRAVLFGQQLRPGARSHQQEDAAADQQREPAAGRQLEQIGGEEQQIHHEEEAGRRDTQPSG
jgi:hypothetical protein